MTVPTPSVHSAYGTRLLPRSLASSTSMISSSSCHGDLFITLQMVRTSVDQASLWKTMTMLVVGNASLGYDFLLHLLYENANNPPAISS